MTVEELKAHASKMGKRSGEVRRKKKVLRDLARVLLDATLQSEDEFREELSKRGIEQTEAAALLFSQLKRARAGDTEAARFLRDTSGQKPADTISFGNTENKPFETLDLSKLSDDQLKTLSTLALGSGDVP